MPKNWQMYNKAIIAFFTALGTWFGTALVDGEITAIEYSGLCGVVVATLSVFQIENKNKDTSPLRGSDGKFIKENA